jgi:hypothetical protein
MEPLLDPAMSQGIDVGGCYPAEEAPDHDLPDLDDLRPHPGYDLPDVDEMIEDHYDDLADLGHGEPAPEPYEDWCGTGDGLELIDL